MIYLDHNATTPVDPEVSDAMLYALSRGFGNPSSSHAAGRLAREIVEDARQRVSDLVGCNPDEIYYTSGGTESNNLAILGTALLYGAGHIISSSIEHPSVSNTLKHLESRGFSVTYAGVDSDCIISVEEIQKAVRKDTILITVMHSNNETGVLQPIDDIGAVAANNGIRFHTDAAQSVGKVEVETGNVDLMSFASHKFYGPKGVGALFVRRGTPLRPLLFGAGHERGMRPGTENVPGIAGMGKACELAKRERETRTSWTARLSNLLFTELRNHRENVRLNGHETLRLPGTLNLRFPGFSGPSLVDSLKDTVAISAGSACHAGVCKPSPVLKAMGIGNEDAMASVRVSIGKDNTEEEIITAARMLSDAVSQQDREH